MVSPITPREEQQQVLDSPARYRVVIADRRWGKTMLCRLAIGQAPFGARIGIICPNFKTTKQFSYSLVPSAQQYIELFSGHRNSANVRGRQFQLLVVDDADQISPLLWDEIYPTLIPDGRLLLVGSYRSVEKDGIRTIDPGAMRLLWKVEGWAVHPENTDTQVWDFHKIGQHNV